MIGRLLMVLPAWTTGRIEARATQEVQSWIQGNPTRRALRYGPIRRLLFWGTDHPVRFLVVVLVTSAAFAWAASQIYAEASQWAPGLLPDLAFINGFNPVEFASVPWNVQATLIALVYPIVLAFVALLLQRKAHSTVSLGVYLLDSAIIPAGISSIGLLVIMGAQYFLTPYAGEAFLRAHLPILLVMNGAWLLLNIVLTAFFLNRTVRFLQDDEQRRAYTRIAVDWVLPSELIQSVKEHIFAQAPEADWELPPYSFDVQPYVLNLGISSHKFPEVTKDFRTPVVLQDVHLRLLAFVARRWRRRAAAALEDQPAKKSPTLYFPAIVGSEISDQVVLCAVEDGPSLTALERVLVRSAFMFSRPRFSTLAISTTDMLGEVALEVQALAEQRRFAVATARLRHLLDLHVTLLKASAERESEGSAATIPTSPYAWAESSFAMEWLTPYRACVGAALEVLPTDERLYRSLTVVSGSLARRLPARPEKVTIAALRVGSNIAYQLGEWWTRRADESRVPGVAFKGTLPPHLDRIYERACTTFVGSWGEFRVSIPTDSPQDDARIWQHLTGRALIYAEHINLSAQMYIRAVVRRDVTASTWLLEHLLKWWGNRTSELRGRQKVEHDFRTRNVTLQLAELDWHDAREQLWDGAEPISLEFAQRALDLAIYRYWEGVRLLVAVLLVRNAGPTPSGGSLEIKHAAALLRRQPQRPGGNVEATSLTSVDDFMAEVVRIIFGVNSVANQLGALAEKIQDDGRRAEVAGWGYQWVGGGHDLESMAQPLAIVLCALADGPRPVVKRTTGRIHRWWKEVDKLDHVRQFMEGLQREVNSEEFAQAESVVTSLAGELQKLQNFSVGRAMAAAALHDLAKLARDEYLATLRAFSVDSKHVQSFAKRVATAAFQGTPLPGPVRRVRFGSPAGAATDAVTFTDSRRDYLEFIGEGGNQDHAERVGQFVGGSAIKYSLARALKPLSPVNDESFRSNVEPTRSEIQSFLVAVALECHRVRAAAKLPVIIVGRTIGYNLALEKWGNADWQCPIPDGIALGKGNSEVENALLQINGVAAFELPTPHGDCYVVDSELLEELIVDGASVDSAVALDFTSASPTQIDFRARWRAGFREAKTQDGGAAAA